MKSETIKERSKIENDFDTIYIYMRLNGKQITLAMNALEVEAKKNYLLINEKNEYFMVSKQISSTNEFHLKKSLAIKVRAQHPYGHLNCFHIRNFEYTMLLMDKY